MELKKQGRRVYLFDNLKFFLILTVVLGHFADTVEGNPETYKSIFIFIYAFHMPLFLFCSGMFHSNKNVFIKALRYISVGFLCKIIFTLSELFLNDVVYFKLLSDNGIPWYMFVLAVYVVITYAFRNIDKRFLLVISILLACFAGYDKSIGDYLYLSRIVVFYPFYLCGQMISKESIIKNGRKKSLKAVSACIIAIWLILCFTQEDTLTLLRPLFTGRNPFSVSEIFEKWGFLYRVLCYIITAVLSFALILLMPDKKIPLITNFGTRTLQVYFWHWPFVLLLKKLGVEAFLMESAVGETVWLIIGVALTLLLSTRLFSFPTKQVFTFCRYVKSDD